MGANHNILRHPDVPALAFKDLWRTITAAVMDGVVKNRRKNGDHYWWWPTSRHHAQRQAGGLPVGAHQAQLSENPGRRGAVPVPSTACRTRATARDAARRGSGKKALPGWRSGWRRPASASAWLRD